MEAAPSRMDESNFAQGVRGTRRALTSFIRPVLFAKPSEDSGAPYSVRCHAAGEIVIRA